MQGIERMPQSCMITICIFSEPTPSLGICCPRCTAGPSASSLEEPGLLFLPYNPSSSCCSLLFSGKARKINKEIFKIDVTLCTGLEVIGEQVINILVQREQKGNSLFNQGKITSILVKKCPAICLIHKHHATRHRSHKEDEQLHSVISIMSIPQTNQTIEG